MGSRLKTLALSGCQLDCYSIFNAVKTSYFSRTLQSLLIAGNKFEQAGQIESLSSYLKEATLKELDISNCMLSGKQVAQLLYAIAENNQSVSITVNISDNNLGPHGAASVASVLEYSHNITGLILRSNGLKKKGLITIMKAAANNLTIKELDLSLNKCTKNQHKLVLPLSELFGEQSEITYLSILDTSIS